MAVTQDSINQELAKGAHVTTSFVNDPSLQGQFTDVNKMNYANWNGDWKGYLEYAAAHGDQAALDKLMNFMMSEESAKNQREWDSHAYSRLFDDMRSAGVNPYAFATLGASPISSSSNTHFSGSYSSSYEIQKQKVHQNWLKLALGAFIPVIGGIIAALL